MLQEFYVVAREMHKTSLNNFDALALLFVQINSAYTRPD